MTKARILLVGEYPPLLDTRALILKDYDCESASSHNSLATLQTGSFDVIVIGQSVSGEKALEIVKAAQAVDPIPQMIAIRFEEDGTALGIEIHKVNFGENPGWLRHRVAFLLAERRAAR
jgi:hypothetical protein